MAGSSQSKQHEVEPLLSGGFDDVADDDVENSGRHDSDLSELRTSELRSDDSDHGCQIGEAPAVVKRNAVARTDGGQNRRQTRSKDGYRYVETCDDAGKPTPP
jgi:hypothetical protein